MDTIETLLTRAIEKIYPSKEALEKVLRSGKKLRVYQGFDPTGIELHIGHLVGLRKLRQFQDSGHEVIFLIGDGTGQTGDPSGKTRAREKFLTREELRKNAKDYVRQAAKVVRFRGENPVKIVYNGDWLTKLTYREILDIAGHFTAQQIFERDLFQERLKKNEAINLREFLYPLFQAYDSVVLDVDLEIGGTDQTFNMLAGRSLMKAVKGKEKFVLTTPLLTDASGKKIGKTEGNVIALRAKPQDLYGGIMSLPDDVIVKGLEYLTDIPMEKVTEIDRKIRKGENPMQFKKLLAFEVVKLLNSVAKAKAAQTFFEQVHQKGSIANLQNIPIIEGAGLSIRELLINKFNTSASKVKRLVNQGAVDINGETVTDINRPLNSGATVQIGKKHFVKIK